MKSFKLVLLYSVLICSITNCASQKFEKETPFGIADVYLQHWNSGVKMGGSGTNIFMELKENLPNHVSLDSIYFDNYQLKLNQDSHNPLLFIGRHIESSKRHNGPVNALNEQKSISKAQPIVSKFKLENNECVVQFTDASKVKYFKYDALYTKETPLVPQAKPNRQ
ncbi:hypothetical protein [Formosa sp. 4Alg 33]|uniref:hypothetical protein n=1 Tax=Formosa sp. 4Alg 33 TaxID=3382189 RepID=UPI003D9C2EF6